MYHSAMAAPAAFANISLSLNEAHSTMSDTENHPFRWLVMNLSWARVLASAAPHIASKHCEEARTQPDADDSLCSAASTSQEQQGLGITYRQQVSNMVNRLRSDEFKDRQTATPVNASPKDHSVAAEAGALHQPGWFAEPTTDSKPVQCVSVGLQPASDNNSAGSLKATITLDRQLCESRTVCAAASELLCHSIRYNMLQ